MKLELFFFLLTTVPVICYKPKRKFLGISALKFTYKTSEENIHDIFSKLFVLQAWAAAFWLTWEIRKISPLVSFQGKLS